MTAAEIAVVSSTAHYGFEAGSTKNLVDDKFEVREEDEEARSRDGMVPIAHPTSVLTVRYPWSLTCVSLDVAKILLPTGKKMATDVYARDARR